MRLFGVGRHMSEIPWFGHRNWLGHRLLWGLPISFTDAHVFSCHVSSQGLILDRCGLLEFW